MSVYDFNKDDLEFPPLRKFQPHIFPTNKRSMRTSSSTDVLLQIQNSGQIRPTPNQTNTVSGGCGEIPMAPKVAGFRPILRHSNSESSIGGASASKTPRGSYRSPQVFLQVRKYLPPNPDCFLKLSDELLLEILRYLPKVSLMRCAKVCRRLNRLSKDEILWKRIDLGAKRIDESTVHRLIGRGVQLLRLAKAEVDSGDEFDYNRMSPCRLQFLDFSMLVARDASVVRGILYRCRSLVALSLEGCDVDDETCTYISRNGNLTMLNLTMARGLTTAGLARILRGCTKLAELHIGWTCLDHECIESACTLFPPTLLKLNISGCRGGSMDDDDVNNLTLRCQRLIEVDISDCTDLTSKSLATVSKNLHNLKTLHCSRCYSIEPNAYTTFCKHLKELNILGTIKEESMPVLKRALPNVEINSSYFSTIARPTVGMRRTSIWEQRVRDD